MNWVKTSEMLPNNQQEILVRIGSMVSLAIFDEPTGTFVVKTGPPLKKNATGLRWTVLIESKTM